ncbi:MAG: GWxTD domain-containing protein [Bacteroidia bacterium]
MLHRIQTLFTASIRIWLACGIWVLDAQSPTYLYRLGSTQVVPLEVISWRVGDTTALQVIQAATHPFQDIFFGDSIQIELVFLAEGMAPQVYQTSKVEADTWNFICRWKVLPGLRGWFVKLHVEGTSIEGFAAGHLPSVAYPWAVGEKGVYAWQSNSLREIPADSFPRLFQPYWYDTLLPTAPYVPVKKSKFLPCSSGAWHLPGLYVWQKSRPLYPPPLHKYLYQKISLSDSLQKLWEKRVREAAMLFTRTIPGERSDRGLLWIFIGPPSAILYAYYKQIWIYENLFSQTVFWEFSFEADEWKLLRRYEYQPIWEKVLSTWRM